MKEGSSAAGAQVNVEAEEGQDFGTHLHYKRTHYKETFSKRAVVNVVAEEGQDLGGGGGRGKGRERGKGGGERERAQERERARARERERGNTQDSEINLTLRDTLTTISLS